MWDIRFLPRRDVKEVTFQGHSDVITLQQNWDSTVSVMRTVYA